MMRFLESNGVKATGNLNEAGDEAEASTADVAKLI